MVDGKVENRFICRNGDPSCYKCYPNTNKGQRSFGALRFPFYYLYGNLTRGDAPPPTNCIVPSNNHVRDTVIWDDPVSVLYRMFHGGLQDAIRSCIIYAVELIHIRIKIPK